MIVPFQPFVLIEFKQIGQFCPRKKCRNHFQLRIHMNCHRFQQLHNQQQDKQVQSATQFPTNAKSSAYCQSLSKVYARVGSNIFRN